MKIDLLVKYGLLSFSLSFAFGIAANSILCGVVIIICIISLIHDYRKKNILFQKDNFSFGMSLFFFLYVLRESFELSNGNTVDSIKNYITFLAFPLLFSLQSQRILKHSQKIFTFFVYGMLFNFLVNISYAFYRGVILTKKGVNYWFFSYDFFSEPFGIQPIYLAFFYVFSILIIIHYHHFFKKVNLFYIGIFLLVTGIFMLAARNAILCLIVLVPIYFFMNIKISKKKIMMIAFGMLLIFFTVIQNPVVKNRIFKITGEDSTYSGTSLRIKIWNSAYEVSKKNLVFGLGEKESLKALKKVYLEKDMAIANNFNYNAHNMYLQILIQSGLLGLIILLFTFFLSIRKFFKERNFLAIFWITLNIIACTTEALYIRQWGILSFTFFTGIFLLQKKSKN